MQIPRTEPPAKFAFLSGIDPDLDEALWETEEMSHADWDDEMQYSSHPSSTKSKRHLERSKSAYVYEEEQYYQTRRSSTGNRVKDKKYDSLSVASKPRDITCTLNETVESIPYSVDGMETAKRKIRSQAAMIRDLEDKLQQASFEGGSVAISEQKPNRRILSPEERLEAHKERKKMEYKHKDQTGKWASAPPIQTQSSTSKVKRNDEFVDRLAAEPTERRRQDEVKRRTSRSTRKSRRNTMDQEDERDSSPLVRRNTVEEDLKFLGSEKKNKKDRQKIKKRGGQEGLMTRLNMGVEERRSMERNDALDAAKRVNKKRQQRGNSDLSNEVREEDRFDVPHQRLSYHNGVEISRNIGRCQTCGSTQNCEEDTDDPGIYYCSLCWDDYDDKSNLDQGFENDSEEESLSLPASIAHSRTQALNAGALWIAHDNPNLGSRLVCSGPSKMSCFIETKDPRIKDCVRILHGTIDYSGPVVKSGDRAVCDIANINRGGECVRLGNLCGYIVRNDVAQTRMDSTKTVYEFQLNENEAINLTGRNAEMSVKQFLAGCDGAVDVILDPQHSSGRWYPIREVASSRKLAPQFRSRGIGYIRLGDEMGNNGQAFISSDCCQTFFFDEPERQNVNTDLLRTVSSFSSKPSYHTRSPKGKRNKKSVGRAQKDNQTDSISFKSARYDLSEEDDSSISSSCSQDEDVNAGEVLKELQNMEVSSDKTKWKDKADLLIKLGKAISSPKGRSWCEGTLNYIQDVISAKNVNIHVLRSALVVVDKTGHVLKDALPQHIAWRTIMIQLLKLLKNKQCGGGAREILQKLHGESYTLANSLIAISHVLGLGKNLATSQRKLTKKNNNNPTPQTNANNVEVIEWLAVTTEAERLLDDVKAAMDTSELETLSSFFMSHESHRDARCRKNALDGLLHTMLYGVDVLDMDIDEVQSFCLELKTSKPKSWSRLMKSLHFTLKTERAR
jgi:hypothetical protein